MDIHAISMLAVPPTAGAPRPTTAEQTRKEFDTLVLQILLENALPGARTNEDSEWSVLGGTLSQLLASELAQRIDLGFGKMLAVEAR